jgi:cytochrome bd-type quinol oxidase subunit 2
MIFEVMLLALASTVRPTSLAAVTALLGRESSRRLMIAYVAGGLSFAFAFGVVVVGVFHGVHLHSGTDRTKAVAELVGGVAALGFGVAVLLGLVRLGDGDAPRSGRGWMARLDHQLTVRVAAFAGPLTHIPGVFYLIALNIIVAHNPYLPGGILAVAVYDGIWFAVPIAALVLCIVDPRTAKYLVLALAHRSQENSRTIVLVTSFVVGLALVVRGLLHL